MSTSAENTMQAGNSGLSVAALVLGILSVVTSFSWVLGVPMGILAIVFGVMTIKSKGRGKSIAGIATGSIGVIFSLLVVVMVYFALPSLQASQRDTSRMNDVSTLSSDITTFQTINMGILPAASDLSTDHLTHIKAVVSEGEPTKEQAVYQAGADCDGDESSRVYSVKVELEDGTIYCQD